MSDSIQQRNRDDWRSILTVPECTDQLLTTSPFWDANRQLSKFHIEQLGARMFAKEFESGDMVIDEEACTNRIIWVLSGNVRVSSDNQPSFQLTKGFLIGAKNYFRKNSEEFRLFSEGCVCGIISHEDIDSLGQYPQIKVQGMQSVQYLDRIVMFKQGQYDLLLNKEKEKELIEKHTRDDDEIRRRREKDKIVRNITDASSNAKMKEEKISKGQYDEVMSRLLASQFASNEAQRANGQLRSEMEQVKQSRDKLMGDQTKANRDKVGMETQLLNQRMELVGEKRSKEAAEYQQQVERKQRELTDEQSKYTQVMKSLDNSQREQRLMDDQQQWKKNAHEQKESLLVFAENGGREVEQQQKSLAKKREECEHWQLLSDALRVTAQSASEEWAKRAELLESQLSAAAEEMNICRRQQRLVANERDHLEGIARQQRSTVQKQAVQIQEHQRELFMFISVRSKVKQRVLLVGKHMSKDIMGAAVKLMLIKFTTRKLCRVAITLCNSLPRAPMEDSEKLQALEQEQTSDLDEKRPIQVMQAHLHDLLIRVACVLSQQGVPRVTEDATGSAKAQVSAQMRKLKALALVGEQARKAGLPLAWLGHAAEKPVVTQLLLPPVVPTMETEPSNSLNTVELPAVLPSLQALVPLYPKRNHAAQKQRKQGQETDFVHLHQNMWKKRTGTYEDDKT